LQVGRVAPWPVAGDAAAGVDRTAEMNTAAEMGREAALDPVFVVWGTR
jgi:hypothetical protein